jgi:hypothetical protein
MGSAHALLAQSVEAADLRSVTSEFKSLGEHQFDKVSRLLEHYDLVSDGMNDGCNPSVLGSIPSEVLKGKCPVRFEEIVLKTTGCNSFGGSIPLLPAIRSSFSSFTSLNPDWLREYVSKSYRWGFKSLQARQNPTRGVKLEHYGIVAEWFIAPSC